jgi:hypothetical protein
VVLDPKRVPPVDALYHSTNPPEGGVAESVAVAVPHKVALKFVGAAGNSTIVAVTPTLGLVQVEPEAVKDDITNLLVVALIEFTVL